METGKEKVMISILKTTIRIYFQNFWLFLKIISLVIIPIIGLRLISHYAYLGELIILYSIAFGVVLGFIGTCAEIMLIKATYQNIQNQQYKSFKQLLCEAMQNFFSYIYIKILISAVILSIPFALKIIDVSIRNPKFSFILKILTISWIASFALLFLFATYSFVIENKRGIKALKRSTALFLKKPQYLIINLGICFLFWGILLVIPASVTSLLIAILTKQTAILFNPYLSPWWQKLVIDGYALLGAPILVIIITLLFIKSREQDQEQEIKSAV